MTWCSFLAHDLKTPLTSVVAYLAMLDAHPDMPEAERAKYIHISLEKAIRLGELINEFFDITKFNLQDIELEPVELNLSMMLEQIADELYGVLQEKQLTCEVETEDGLVVYGDPDKLARVFDNILRNAIAYCYAGRPYRSAPAERIRMWRLYFPTGERKFRAQSCRLSLRNFTAWTTPDPARPAGQGLAWP